ncbi:septum formation initiator family protein [Candidatus Uhrbacteria bacterium]|nr:septum formation initiator family protein [Candidatus Uhrbacteria bacterium]
MIVIFLSLSLGREVVRNKTIASEIAVLEAQAGQLITENLAISELQSALQSESFIEREARLKLGMKKPGEGVVVIQDRIDGQVVNSGESDPFGFVIDPEAEVVEDVSNTSKWWYYFFDKTNYDRHQSS